MPVQFSVGDGEPRRGFITRLSAISAALSSDPAIDVGATVTLSFKRPSDSSEIRTDGSVAEHLSEGGLWRGHPAALVRFAAAVELEEGESVEVAMEAPEPLGAPMSYAEPEPDTEDFDEDETATGPRLAAALRPAGLGRRRLTRRLRRDATTTPARRAESGAPPVQTDSSRAVPTQPPSRNPDSGSIRAALSEGFFDDPSQGEEPAVSTHAAEEFDQSFSQFFASDDATVPPRKLSETDPELGDDAAFIAQFGGPAELPASMLDPLGDEDSSEPRSLPDHAISPASVPRARVPQAPTVQRLSNDAAPVSNRPPQPRSGGTSPGSERSKAPWEDIDENAEVASLIPRNARITSTLDVHFWARGRRNSAVADNFSREGLFLTYSGTPPVRGAIVRVEFPLEGDDESVPVRFNAEVRWHRSDRPGVGLPEGFGVQILTFETPKDRARYLELLDAILALGPATGGVEEGFSWGRPGR